MPISKHRRDRRSRPAQVPINRAKRARDLKRLTNAYCQDVQANQLREQEEVVIKVTWLPSPGRGLPNLIRQESRDGRFLYQGRSLTPEARALTKKQCGCGPRYYLAKHEQGIPFFKLAEPLSEVALSLVGGPWESDLST